MMQEVYKGDCLEILDLIPNTSVDLIYLDPPFFSQKTHRMGTRDGTRTFSFSDVWDNPNSYTEFIGARLTKLHSKLSRTGSIFFHCDRSASHMIRVLLDRVFGAEHFQSEIVWYFRRWSNAKRGLLNSHQKILFYSKTKTFKFNPIFQDYSSATNVEQIMQKRARDRRNKSVYARDQNGDIAFSGTKKGVPLSDVWEIPFLNPTAKERVGFPTQKPVLLLNRIIELVTDPGDVVLDPFCGSGTTLVASKILGRQAIGIDQSGHAVDLTKSRLQQPVVTTSRLLKLGRHAYTTHDSMAAKHLGGVDYTPVHRNKGIDGILKREADGVPVFVRVQRDSETRYTAALSLIKATKDKGRAVLVVITTGGDLVSGLEVEGVHFVQSLESSLCDLFSSIAH